MRRSVVLTLVGIAAFAAALSWLAWPPDESPYHELVARLRAAGEPVDSNGAKDADVPREENGAADLLAAIRWLDENITAEQWQSVHGTRDSGIDADYEPTSEEEREVLARFTDGLTPFFDGVRGAVAKRRIQFRGKCDVTGFPDDDHAMALVRITRLLSIQCRRSRDPARRLEGIVSTAALADRVECGGVLDHLVAADAAISALRALRSEVGFAHLDVSSARTALDPLLRGPWVSRISHALRYERAYQLQAYRTVLDGTRRTPISPGYVRLWNRICGRAQPEDITPGMADVIVQNSGMFDRALAIASRPAQSQRAEIAAVAAGPRRSALSWLPLLFDRLLDVEAAQALTRVALAAAEFRERTGSLPLTSDALSASFPDGVPLDPYTRAAFVFAATPTGLRIESPGCFAGDTAPVTTTPGERCLVWELPK